jgi:hypothetical protein
MNALSPISEKTEIPTRKLAIYVKILTISFQNAIKQVFFFLNSLSKESNGINVVF